MFVEQFVEFVTFVVLETVAPSIKRPTEIHQRKRSIFRSSTFSEISSVGTVVHSRHLSLTGRSVLRRASDRHSCLSRSIVFDVFFHHQKLSHLNPPKLSNYGDLLRKRSTRGRISRENQYHPADESRAITTRCSPSSKYLTLLSENKNKTKTSLHQAVASRHLHANSSKTKQTIDRPGYLPSHT